MTDTDIHSCGYYCDRPACIKAQRDELREKMFLDGVALTSMQHPVSLGKPSKHKISKKSLETMVLETEWVGLTDEELLDLADMAYANDLELLQTLQAKLKEKNT